MFSFHCHFSNPGGPQRPRFFSGGIVALCCAFVLTGHAQEGGESGERDRLVVETILRMESFDYSGASAKVTAAIGRYLAAHPGSDEFFTLVERFGITGQSAALLEIAAGDTAGQGSRAVQCLMRLGGLDSVMAATVDPAASEQERANLMRALVLTGRPEAIDALVEIILAVADRELPVRTSAVRALGASRAGEKKLLALAAEGHLMADLTVTAAGVLQASTDQAVREEAARHLQMPASSDAKPLPPLSELLKRTGDAGRGNEVYRRACFICHQVGGEGIAFGPALTEIGDKLPAEALYLSILEPGAAISFGFEGFEFTLDDGSAIVGIVASETDAEIVVRIPGGSTISLAKERLSTREKLRESLMPSNLAAAMSEEDLVDLISYLMQLRKK